MRTTLETAHARFPHRIRHFCLTIPAHATPAPASTLQDLLTTQSLIDSIADNKPHVWKSTLADDVSIIDEFGWCMSRPMRSRASGDFRRASPATSSCSTPARTYGETAVLVCDADEYERVFDQHLHVLYRSTDTFVRHAGAWKLVAMQDVTVPTTPPPLVVAGLHLDDYPGVYRYGADRAYTVASDGKSLSYTTRAGRLATAMLPIARDLFMDDGDEKNLLIFHRDMKGAIDYAIERRKFNDLVLRRDSASRSLND